ncbi:MAG: class I adenylate-forming enzyme family protein [Pseudomonadota bacterium]
MEVKKVHEILPFGNAGYLIKHHADTAPDAIAVVDFPQRVRRETTYGALDKRANGAAASLLARNIKPGERVGIVIGNRREFVEAYFGALRMGATPVLVNFRLGSEQIADIIEDADCVAAIIDPEAGPGVSAGVMAQALPKGVLALRDFSGATLYEEALAAVADDKAPAPFHPPKDHPAYQPYTSGSTGKPKGVVLTHKGVEWLLNEGMADTESIMDRDARCLLAAPLFHANAMTSGVQMTLHKGGRLVVLPTFEPKWFLEALSGEGCTITSGVPAMLAMMLSERELIKTLNFEALKVILVGSAPCPAALIEATERAFGTKVAQGYGLTEGGPMVMTQPLDPSRIGLDRIPHDSCGVPLPGCSVKLVDAMGEECNPGELLVRNPGVMTEYYNMPEQTAARFAEGWLKTGDIMERDTYGLYYFRGRSDDMFNCGGENVYPLEVENILMSHPDVVNACVIPLDHAVKGQVPAALVVLRKDSNLDERALQGFFLENGPAYAHPRRIDFVDAMPVSGVGKADRKAVMRHFAKYAEPSGD